MKLHRTLIPAMAALACAFAQAAPAPAASAAETLPLIGSIAARDAATIKGSNWLLGCETLDRDFTNYDAYKGYLAPLGIARLRLQAGWAKTEKTKGVYDWAWLDHIVDDATKRGLKPWLQLSYGNSIYAGGGGTNLSAGIPSSPEALAAWDRWVAALVTRYRNRVVDWEVWNEPNFGDNTINTPEGVADLSGRSAAIIKRLQPGAKISGLALGHIDLDYAESFFKMLHARGQIGLFDNMTYHDYVYNPDMHYPKVVQLREILHKYAPGMRLRQGENGAPSVGHSGGALHDYPWTENSQAKWNTRRMLGDLGHDIESSVFSIIEMAYTNGPISTFNTKGLIKSNSAREALRPKVAYGAVQTLTSVFDDSLQRIRSVKSIHNDKVVPANPDDVIYNAGTDRAVAVYGYRNPARQLDVYTLWISDTIPADSMDKKGYRVSMVNARFKEPVYVDVVTGKVHAIPADQWSTTGAKVVFKNIPLYDGPILIADKSLLKITPAAALP
ncbi:MAG: hypothetical protein V4857_01630 [Pseudomonadota bacterium]